MFTSYNKSLNVKHFRQPPIHKRIDLEQTEEYLQDGIIQLLLSPYNSPVWVVSKKPDSQGNKRWRMVVDHRGLNEKAISDSYPLLHFWTN